MASAQQRLGGLLLEMGFIDQEQLRAALDRQAKSGKRLGKVLVETGLITEDRLVHALSRQLGIEACDPIMTPIHDSVLALVPPEIAFTHRVLPVARQRETQGESLYVATADPLDTPAQEALATLLPATTELRWMLAGETEMDLALARHYGAAPPNFVDPESLSELSSLDDNPDALPTPEVLPTSEVLPSPEASQGPQALPGSETLQSPEALQSTGDILTALREAVELSRDIPQKPPGVASPGVDGPVEGVMPQLPGALSVDLAQQISEVEALLETHPSPSAKTGWSTDIIAELAASNGQAVVVDTVGPDGGADSWGDMLEHASRPPSLVERVGMSGVQPSLPAEISVPVPVELSSADLEEIPSGALDLRSLVHEASVLPVADPTLGVDHHAAALVASPCVTDDIDEIDGTGAVTSNLRDAFADAPSTLVMPLGAERLHSVILDFARGAALDEQMRDDVLRVIAASLLQRGDLTVDFLRALLDERSEDS